MFRLPLRRRTSAFTLIELAVVIVIIAVIAGIALPTFLRQRERATDRAMISNLVSANKLAFSYYMDRLGGKGSFTGFDPDSEQEWPSNITWGAPLADGQISVVSTSRNDRTWTLIQVVQPVDTDAGTIPVGTWVGNNTPDTWADLDTIATHIDADGDGAADLDPDITTNLLTPPGVASGSGGSGDAAAGPGGEGFPEGGDFDCFIVETLDPWTCEAVVRGFSELNVANWFDGWTSGPFTSSEIWFTGQDPCEWFGITCETFTYDWGSYTYIQSIILDSIPGLAGTVTDDTANMLGYVSSLTLTSADPEVCLTPVSEWVEEQLNNAGVTWNSCGLDYYTVSLDVDFGLAEYINVSADDTEWSGTFTYALTARNNNQEPVDITYRVQVLGVDSAPTARKYSWSFEGEHEEFMNSLVVLDTLETTTQVSNGVHTVDVGSLGTLALQGTWGWDGPLPLGGRGPWTAYDTGAVAITVELLAVEGSFGTVIPDSPMSEYVLGPFGGHFAGILYEDVITPDIETMIPTVVASVEDWGNDEWGLSAHFFSDGYFLADFSRFKLNVDVVAHYADASTENLATGVELWAGDWFNAVNPRDAELPTAIELTVHTVGGYLQYGFVPGKVWDFSASPLNVTIPVTPAD